MKKPNNKGKKSNPYRPNLSKPVHELKKVNPFEVHVNHSKFTVLGQKSKNDRGLPGVSRAKANKNREETLLPEYKTRLKNNVFNDRRIGENNVFMDAERKLMLRMTAEKKRQFSRKAKFNLNDDEELTHGGTALTDATMNDIFSDCEDDDDILDAQYVKDHHFGGSAFQPKNKPDSKEADGESKPKEHRTRQEWIQEMIADYKKKKHDQQKVKEVQVDAVFKINEKYGEFLSLMSGKTLTDEDKEKSKKDDVYKDYDVLYNTLQFDRCRKAPATDRLKTAEEIATEEKKRLEKLEEDRVRRMQGKHGKKQENSQSADALDDGFKITDSFRDQVSYNEGVLTSESTIQMPKKKTKQGFQINDERNTAYEDGKTAGENDEGASDVESGSEYDESDQYSDILEDDEEEEDSDLQLDDSDEDNDSDLQLDDSDEDNDEEVGSNYDEINKEVHVENGEVESRNVVEPNTSSGRSSTPGESAVNGEVSVKKKKSLARVKFLDREKKMEEAKKEIPYTFEVPTEYEDFSHLLEGRSLADFSTIIDRMITCNHPRLGGYTQDKATMLINYLLQTLHVVCSPDPDEICTDVNPLLYVDVVIPHLYTLVQLSPKIAANSLNQVIDEKYKDFRDKNIKRYPHAETFIFFKITGLLFPTSDAYHTVTTRVICFMTHILSESRVKNRRDIVALLFTVYTLLEFLNKSHRFVGEIVNVLKGILYTAIPLSTQKIKLPHLPPFRKVGEESEILILKSLVESYNPPQLSLSGLNEDLPIDDDFRIKALNESLSLLDKFCRLWSSLPSVRSLFDPVVDVMNEIPLENYPEETHELFAKFIKTFEGLPRIGKPIWKEEKRPKALRMIEPRIQKMMVGAKDRDGNENEAQLETQKLIHKVKREKKAVNRELKRDAEFIAREVHKEERQSDAERKRKVNLIMSGLSTQEGDFNKMTKKKKFK